LRASLVAVAVVVLGAGVVYGATWFGGTQVADLPSLSATPSETPSPSPNPTETGLAWPGFTGSLTVDPHLPSASAITRDVWASVEPGWSLISYREAWVAGDRGELGPLVVYLVSPEGDRYELVNVPGETVSVLAWEAGSATAAVSVQPEGDPSYAGVLNLVTGEVTPVDGYAPYIWSVAFLDSEGSPVWTGNDGTSAYVAIAPDGTQAEYSIPAAEGAAEIAIDELGLPGVDCAVAAPYDDESSLVHCVTADWAEGLEVDPADIHFAVVRVWPADARAELLYGVTGDEGRVSNPTRAGDYTVGSTGGAPNECSTQYSVLANGNATAVPGVGSNLHPLGDILLPLGSVGSVLTWGVTSGCTDGVATPIVVVNSDLASDEYAVLVPYPEGRPAGEEPNESVTGVAVGR